jgi:UDP-N-acetylmuramoylalanine--D-glutamate ligase
MSIVPPGKLNKEGIMELKNKRVTVIGLGNSGVNAAMLLKDKGASVKATDSGNGAELRKTKARLEALGIEVEIGGHTAAFIEGQDLVVVSPGVVNSSPALKMAAKAGIEVIGEMELGFAFCKGKVIAITGTNGKSTVTTLIGAMLKAGGLDAVVCGNIGNSLCGEVARIGKDTWVVLEVSSAQLERISSFKPRIAVILNVTDDHMDRYRSFYEYFNQKLKIFSRQDDEDILILNYDAENLRSLKGLAKPKVLFYGKEASASSAYSTAAYAKDGIIYCTYVQQAEEVMSVTDVRLKGVHNLENVIVSSLVGRIAGVKPRHIRDAVAGFTGLEHRFETVDTVDGVEYIDDSKGTTVDSTRRALESCAKPVVLIAGGKDKFSDYGAVKDAVKEKVRHLVLIGEAAGAIRKALGDQVPVTQAKTMREAVEAGRRIAKSGWAVLLSPMCSSFDMYKDYRERGEAFREAVKAVKAASSAVKA